MLIICVMQSGLKVGDMILAINTESFLDISYDTVGCQSSLLIANRSIWRIIFLQYRYIAT